MIIIEQKQFFTSSNSLPLLLSSKGIINIKFKFIPKHQELVQKV